VLSKIFKSRASRADAHLADSFARYARGRAPLVFVLAALLLAAPVFAQFKSPDVKPGKHRPEPVRRTFFIGTPSAVQSTAVGAFQCLDNTLFPANFAGLFPDANASASCGTNPSESDTYTFKIAGTTIGQVVLSGPAAITEVNSWAGARPQGLRAARSTRRPARRCRQTTSA
jgi:hypothetical protein